MENSLNAPSEDAFIVEDCDLCSENTASIVVAPNFNWVLNPNKLCAPFIKDPLIGILTFPNSIFWIISSSSGV